MFLLGMQQVKKVLGQVGYFFSESGISGRVKLGFEENSKVTNTLTISNEFIHQNVPPTYSEHEKMTFLSVHIPQVILHCFSWKNKLEIVHYNLLIFVHCS